MSREQEKPVHVLHVVPTLGAGGLELAMSRVVNALVRQGMRHSICCLKGEAVIRDHFDGTVDIHCLRSVPNDVMLPFRLRKLIRTTHPTLIHARNWGAWPDTVLARLSVLPQVPLIFSFHGSDSTGWMPLRRRITCRLLACATDYIFTVCAASRNMLAKDIGLSAERVAVISNGVDTCRFCPSPT
ncbi:hypothetical protein LCGC14_2577150, partial [marine sediment metagenome]